MFMDREAEYTDMANQDCVQEARALCAARWQADEVARGTGWMEIVWRRGDEERFFMMVYGRKNIEAVARLTGGRH